MSGRDFVASSLLLLVVFHDDLAHSTLEVKRSHFLLRVKLAVDKDTSVEVLLGVDAQVFVLRHDSFVHVADKIEVLIARILIAVDFISHY